VTTITVTQPPTPKSQTATEGQGCYIAYIGNETLVVINLALIIKANKVTFKAGQKITEKVDR
jgi:hypothetical protein